MALLWRTHIHHERVTQWQEDVELAVCPLSELGFLRISTQSSFGLSLVAARRVLRDWKRAQQPEFISCDLETLDSDTPPTGTRTTDFYLTSLAAKHGMQLATLDLGIRHDAAFVIPS